MYEDRRLPDFDDMEEIAWPLTSKSAGTRAGFVLVTEAKKQTAREDEQQKPEEAPAATVEQK